MREPKERCFRFEGEPVCDLTHCPTPDECVDCYPALQLCSCPDCHRMVISCWECQACRQLDDMKAAWLHDPQAHADEELDRYGLRAPSTSTPLASGINTYTGSGTAAWAGNWVGQYRYQVDELIAFRPEHDLENRKTRAPTRTGEPEKRG